MCVNLLASFILRELNLYSNYGPEGQLNVNLIEASAKNTFKLTAKYTLECLQWLSEGVRN